MNNDFVATASTKINPPAGKVWDALTNPATIKRYMFDTTVTSDWKEECPITWTGEWKGRAYEDKGVILQFKPTRLLQYTHFSPLTGVPDKPENCHRVTIELLGEGNSTQIALSQDGNPTAEARDHSQKNWEMMLGGLKKVVEE